MKLGVRKNLGCFILIITSSQERKREKDGRWALYPGSKDPDVAGWCAAPRLLMVGESGGVHPYLGSASLQGIDRLPCRIYNLIEW